MDRMANNDNIKVEKVCRTCLTDDGPFFNITDIFDHYTLTQMIQNITNLKMNPLDGYTQFICFQCVKEVRRANQFRTKCLESNDTLMKADIKPAEIPIIACKVEMPNIENIKKESVVNYNIAEDSCDISDYLEAEDDPKSAAPDAESDSDSESNDNLYIAEEDEKDSQDKIFDCPLCHGLFKNTKIYMKHVSDLHPDRLNDECFEQKREALGFILKNPFKNGKTSYKCALDDFAGNTFAEFQNHMKEHTGEKPVVCVECGFLTTDIQRLKGHRLQKHEENKFSCTLCSYACKTQRALTSHSTIHTGERNFQCKLCPMIFRHSSTLSLHKKEIHDKRKPHVCSVCEKAFSRKTEIRAHMRSHTGERPFVCHYCGQGFMRPDAMKAHVIQKHEHDLLKTIYKCDMCDYTTKIKLHLKSHVIKHCDVKPFRCPHCPFSTLAKKALKVHLVRHTGQKSFACDLCDYKGFTLGSVKSHKKTHFEERPFACTMCDYRAKRKTVLLNHIQTHDTELRFECPNCPFKTNVKKTLGTHLRNSCFIKQKAKRSSTVKVIPAPDLN